MLTVPPAPPDSVRQQFDLTGRVAVITGGAGLLGVKHAETVAELGGVPVLVDIAEAAVRARAAEIATRFSVNAAGLYCDITSEDAVAALRDRVLDQFGRVDVLINNAARNPKVEAGLSDNNFLRFENFPMDVWQLDIAVGLTGAYLCCRYFGTSMAQAGRGSIINIASQYGLVAPNQSLYRIDGRPEDEQPVKPVTYTVVKAGIVGLTKYLATYWPGRVRVNALAPGGVYAGQSDEFLERISAVVPMGRLGHHDEFKGAIAFLASDASTFMTGATLVVDGGLTAW